MFTCELNTTSVIYYVVFCHFGLDETELIRCKPKSRWPVSREPYVSPSPCSHYNNMYIPSRRALPSLTRGHLVGGVSDASLDGATNTSRFPAGFTKRLRFSLRFMSFPSFTESALKIVQDSPFISFLPLLFLSGRTVNEYWNEMAEYIWNVAKSHRVCDVIGKEN